MDNADSSPLSNHPFHLTKWYMDVCDDKGNTFIGYAVKLSWRKLSVNYRGYILTDSQGNNFTHGKTGDVFFPAADQNQINWNSPEVNGTWIKKLNSIEETVPLPGDHQFHWKCVQPLSEVKVTIENKMEIHGRGYAEIIELDLQPWKLPIQTLYWGRFTAESHSVSWIHWKGELPITMVYVNGERFDSVTIDETGIRFPGGIVQFGEQRKLRSGKLSETVLKSFTFLKRIFPLKALSIEENKWFCNAVYARNDGQIIKGQCIHEIVNFGKRS